MAGRWIVAMVTLAVLGSPAGMGGAVDAGEAPSSPNVLLVVVDTLRAEHLSLYGYGRPTSPHLDRLGAESWVFERAYTVMSHTLPAHVSLMTCLHPATHGVLANGWRYDGEAPTLAELLHRARYRTGAFVSGLPVNGATGLARGFDTYADTASGRGKPLERIAGERTTARALEWLGEDRARPFFLFVHYFDTHLPYRHPDDVPRRFAVDDRVRQLMMRRGLVGVAAEELLHHPILLNGAELGIADGINAYDNQIHRVDAQIGALLAGLEDARRLADTLIVVTSDHGEGLGDHGYWSHGLHLYEEQIHVPLIVRPPRGARWAPVRPGHVVSLLDVLPTVARYTPIDAPPGCQGRSLTPVHAGAPRWLVAQRRHYDPKVRARQGRFAAGTTLHALRGDGRLKYLRGGDGREELYDLLDDPGERRDLAATREGEVAELRTVLERRLAHVSSGVPIAAPVLDSAVSSRLKALGYL